MNELPTFDQLIELLRGILSGNNQLIQQGTQYLKKYVKFKESVGPLTLILSQNPDQSLRHLAGILLKRNMIKLYETLDQTAQEELKMILIQRFFDEQSQVIRNSIANLIGCISVLTLSDGKWPQLYEIIGQQTNLNHDIQVRRRGLELLGLILEYTGDSLKAFYGNFYPFFCQTIQDQDKQIRIQTVKCLIQLFDNIDSMEKEHINLYKELVNPILKVVDQCQNEEDNELVGYCIDAFSYLAESKMTILDSHLTIILEYACGSILLNKKLEVKVRERVLDMIVTIAGAHKSIFNKNQQLLAKIIEVICFLISEPFLKQPKTGEDDLEDELHENLQDVALWVISQLCFSLNKKKLFKILLEAITLLLNSNEPNKQNSAFLILAQISEGLSDQISKHISNPIMNTFIPRGLASEHPEVKGACIKAISYLTEYIPSEIIQFHAQILPPIVSSLVSSTNVKVVEKSMFTIDVFCENMEADIVPYLEQLIATLVQIPYQNDKTTKTKKAAVSGIASCITSAQLAFKPYLAKCYPLLHEILTIQDTPENLTIKAEAINALGKVANIFCHDDAEVYQLIIHPVLDHIYNLLIGTKDSEIREGCFSFFYSLAAGVKEKFEPFFDKIIEITLLAAQSMEGVEAEKAQKEFSLDTDSEDSDGEVQQVRVRSTYMDEKAAAIHALGEFAIACPMKFQPYFERAFAILDSTYQFFYENVRIQTMICFGFLIEAMVACAYQGQLPPVKRGLPCSTRYPQEIENLISIELWTKISFVITEDEDSEVVAYAIDTLTGLVRKLGPAFFHAFLEDLIQVIMKVLEGQCKCQNPNSDDDIEDEETDQNVFEQVTDLIPALARMLESAFELSFAKIVNSLSAYLDTERDIDDNIQSVGCFAVTFRKAPSLIRIYQDILVPQLTKMVEVGDDELNRNISFCLGIMVERSLDSMTQHLQNVLYTLKVVFERAQDLECKENAAAALCRIVIVATAHIPAELALQQIFAIAPFVGDEDEQKTLLKMVVYLAANHGNLLQPYLELTMRFLIDGLANLKKYKIKEKLKNDLITLTRQFASQQNYQQFLQQLVNNLGEAQKLEVIQMIG